MKYLYKFYFLSCTFVNFVCLSYIYFLFISKATVKEVTVSIPSALTTKFAGDQAPSLRSICEQCEGVHIRFANNNNNNKNTKGQSNKLSHMEIIVLGPEKEVQQACALLDQLNARVSQLCAEVSLKQQNNVHISLTEKILNLW